MEILIVLTVGGFLFWLLYGRGSDEPKQLTQQQINAMVPGQWITPWQVFKYAAIFMVVFAATSWMGGISLLIAATALLLIGWRDTA